MFEFLPRATQDFLSDVNDHQKWSFNKIANWIEKNL